MIIDASVVLSAFFPDESQAQAQAVLREHVAGRLHLKAPALLPYELSNAVWQAERRGRITRAQADEIMQALAGLEIEIISQEWGEMLPLARRFERSAYDAAYLALAEKTGEPLITGDERLFNAVHGEVGWVVWISEYTAWAEGIYTEAIRRRWKSWCGGWCARNWHTMKSKIDLAKFDHRRLAFYEKENYVAYYRKRWLRLLFVSIAMVKEAYQLSLLQAIYAAYLVVRAEMAAAPFPDNDIPGAEAYMRRLFLFLKRIYAFQFDVAAAAHQEVNWWVVHRRLFAQADNQEVIEALAGAMAAFLGKPAQVFLPAAEQQHARGILYSDQWVRSGMDGSSPLLQLEEEALGAGYSRPRDAPLASPCVRVPRHPRYCWDYPPMVSNIPKIHPFLLLQSDRLGGIQNVTKWTKGI